jgi:hypothetical protein
MWFPLCCCRSCVILCFYVCSFLVFMPTSAASLFASWLKITCVLVFVHMLSCYYFVSFVILCLYLCELLCLLPGLVPIFFIFWRCSGSLPSFVFVCVQNTDNAELRVVTERNIHTPEHHRHTHFAGVLCCCVLAHSKLYLNWALTVDQWKILQTFLLPVSGFDEAFNIRVYCIDPKTSVIVRVFRKHFTKTSCLYGSLVWSYPGLDHWAPSIWAVFLRLSMDMLGSWETYFS